MNGRRVALVLSALASACSSTPREGPAAPAATASVTKPVEEAQPRPPRKLTGLPVVLALRQPTKIPGAEWAWIMPEGRLATLTPPDAKGGRAILGANFFAGPSNAFVGIDLLGKLELAVDGQVHHLGTFDVVAFDAQERNVLAWSSAEWALFARSGERLRGDGTGSSRPTLLPSGLLVEHVGRNLTRVIRPPSEVRLHTPLHCNELFPNAGRLLCASAGKDQTETALSVFALDRQEQWGPFLLRGESRLKPLFAVRADGGAVASILERVEVIDLVVGSKKVAPRLIFRRKDPVATWRLPTRAAFTLDGRHLCIEEIAETRVLDTSAEWKNGGAGAKPGAAKDTRRICLFAPRGAESIGPDVRPSAIEWDAMLVRAPVREGFQPAARFVSARGRIETTDVSFDRTTGALVEHRMTDLGEMRRFDVQAVVFDMATGAVRRVIPVGSVEGTRRELGDWQEIGLSEDGATLRVCSRRLFAGACRTYATVTGAESAGPHSLKQGATRTELHSWTGAWPEVHVEQVRASLEVPTTKKATVSVWKDEGKYISVELAHGGGAAVRLNVPDSEARVTREVMAVAGGAMLGIVQQATIELWSVQPLQLRAVLVVVDGGLAALFDDGSIEAIGNAESALGCQQGQRIVPIDQCGDVRAAKGTLTEVVKAAVRAAN